MPFEREKVLSVFIEEEMKSSYIDYSMSVITARALPDVRDGLKPSNRRVLVAMNDLNLAPGRPHRKCAAWFPLPRGARQRACRRQARN